MKKGENCIKNGQYVLSRLHLLKNPMFEKSSCTSTESTNDEAAGRDRCVMCIYPYATTRQTVVSFALQEHIAKTHGVMRMPSANINTVSQVTFQDKQKLAYHCIYIIFFINIGSINWCEKNIINKGT